MDESVTPDPFDYSNQRLLREKASECAGQILKVAIAVTAVP